MLQIKISNAGRNIQQSILGFNVSLQPFASLKLISITMGLPAKAQNSGKRSKKTKDLKSF